MAVQAEPITSPLLDDLGAAIRRTLLMRLPVDPSCTMSALDVSALISLYVNWRERVPRRARRRIHVSRELLANSDRAQYGDGLIALLHEITSGADLRPRMSTAVDHAYEPPTHRAIERKHRDGRHLDRLLAEWGIHHVHLGNGPHKKLPGFKARSRHVLFAVFHPRDAYLIDLYDHERHGANWSELAILEIVARNWPDAGIITPLEDLSLVGGNHSDEERRTLRRRGVSTVGVEIDGRLWSTSRFLTVVGTSSLGSRHGMTVSWFLSGYAPTHGVLAEGLTSMAAEHGVPDAWRGWVLGEDFGFLSQCGRVFVREGSLLP